MKIAFFGSSLLSAYWNGAATYYRGIIYELYQRGHRVTFYEPAAYDREYHYDLIAPNWVESIVYKDSAEEALMQIKNASDSDVIIKASGVGVHDELLERAVLDHKKPGKTIIFWDVDAPATLDRLRNNPNDPLCELIPNYDAIITYGGGMAVMAAYQQFGANLCVPIYNALDPNVHFPVDRDSRFEADVSFLGNRLPDREHRVDEYFLRAAELSGHCKFLLGGSGWLDKRLPGNVHYVGHVYTNDHNAFNCSGKIIVNINRESMAQCGYSPATRIFEAAGAAACIVTDAWSGIDEFFELDKEILLAQSAEDISEYSKTLSEDRALTIGRAARQRALNDHTYQKRTDQLEQLLNMLS